LQNFRTKPIIESQFLGYDDLHPSQLLSPGKFQILDNVYGSDNKIVKVFGSTAIAASIAAYPFNGLCSFEKISASAKYLIANLDGVSSAAIYSWAGSGAFTKISGANTFALSTPMNFYVAADYVGGLNQAQQFDWNGTTFTYNRSGVPLGLYACYFHNYLFIANTVSYPNRLYFSNIGDPTTFVGANYVDINPGDSDSITGMGMLQDELFVFKKQTIWSITGWDGTSFAATTASTENTNVRLMGYGCIAPRSIVAVGNDIYFLSYLSGTPQIRSLKKTQFAATLGGGVISYDITGTMGNISRAGMQNTIGAFDGRYCYWAVTTGSSTTNNKMIVLDTWGIVKVKNIQVYPWTTMSSKSASYMCTSSISGSDVIYFSDTSPTSGLVFKFDPSVYTDNGQPITLTAVPRTFMTDPSRKSKWKYIYFKYNTGVSSILNVSARVEKAQNYTLQEGLSLAGNSPGLGQFILGTSILGGQATIKHRTTFAQMTGTMLDVQLQETSSNPVTIYDFEVYAIPRGLRND
jgi:hypothetical protein